MPAEKDQSQRRRREIAKLLARAVIRRRKRRRDAESVSESAPQNPLDHALIPATIRGSL